MLQKSSEKAEELLSIVLKCTFDVMSKKAKNSTGLASTIIYREQGYSS